MCDFNWNRKMSPLSRSQWQRQRLVTGLHLEIVKWTVINTVHSSHQRRHRRLAQQKFNSIWKCIIIIRPIAILHTIKFPQENDTSLANNTWMSIDFCDVWMNNVNSALARIRRIDAKIFANSFNRLTFSLSLPSHSFSLPSQSSTYARKFSRSRCALISDQTFRHEISFFLNWKFPRNMVGSFDCGSAIWSIWFYVRLNRR